MIRLIVFLFSTWCASVSAAAIHKSSVEVAFESEVLSVDYNGRIEAMRLRGVKGVCVAQIVYDPPRRIEITATTLGGPRSVGQMRLRIPGAYPDNAVLKKGFDEALAICRPLIMNG